jgi:zinc protease
MNKLIAGALLTAFALGAQTEVRKAVVLPSYKDLKFPPLPPLKIPEPESFTLPNGMKVFLLEDHELPLVSGIALIRTGNLFDPADKHGVAEITGEVLRSGGTKTKTGDQIDVDLENVAASIESQIVENYGSLSFSCLKENTDAVLALVEDLMANPEFREDKVDLSKTQLRSSISRRNDDANEILSREFDRIVYGPNTPYGWIVNYADVDNIQRKDLQDFYRRYYFPANVMMAIHGDFSSSELKEKLTRIFGGWTVQQPAVPPFPKVEEKPRPGIFLATKSDVTQTFSEMGHLGGEVRDKDYPAVEVAANILGGGFSSRLFQRIRTKEGYAYNIGASWGAQYDHRGTFAISGSTQSAHTVDSIKAAREELERVCTSEVTDAELKTAKDTILNGFVFNFDRPSKTLNRLLTYEYFGYPKDFVFQYQKAIEAVTKADVLRAAKEHFKPGDLTVVAVGNPKDFGTPLTTLGEKVENIDLTIPEPKKEAATVDADSLAKGKALLARVQQALGGADKLVAIKDAVSQAEVAISTPGAVMKAKQKNSYASPSSFRQELELPFGKQTVYSNGSAGWMVAMQGSQNLPPAVIKQVQGEVFRQIFRLAMSDREPGAVVNYAGEGLLDIREKSGESAQLQVDEKTGMPLKVMYQGTAMGGPPSTVEETYADWRDVNGIRVPFQRTILQGGKKFAEVTVQDFKFNAGLSDGEISKKP